MDELQAESLINPELIFQATCLSSSLSTENKQRTCLLSSRVQSRVYERTLRETPFRVSCYHLWSLFTWLQLSWHLNSQLHCCCLESSIERRRTLLITLCFHFFLRRQLCKRRFLCFLVVSSSLRCFNDRFKIRNSCKKRFFQMSRECISKRDQSK